MTPRRPASRPLVVATAAPRPSLSRVSPQAHTRSKSGERHARPKSAGASRKKRVDDKGDASRKRFQKAADEAKNWPLYGCRRVSRVNTRDARTLAKQWDSLVEDGAINWVGNWAVTKPGRGDAAAVSLLRVPRMVRGPRRLRLAITCLADDPRRGRGVDATKPTEMIL